MAKKRNAGIVSTTAAMIDREIGERVDSESVLAEPPAATPAPGLTPLEAAVLSLNHDLNTILDHCKTILVAVSAFETFARAVSVDIRDIETALAAARSARPPA